MKCFYLKANPNAKVIQNASDSSILIQRREK